jgi:hypothetical protein
MSRSPSGARKSSRFASSSGSAKWGMPTRKSCSGLDIGAPSRGGYPSTKRVEIGK